MSRHSGFPCGAANLSKAAIMLGAWLLGTGPAVVWRLLFNLYVAGTWWLRSAVRRRA